MLSGRRHKHNNLEWFVHCSSDTSVQLEYAILFPPLPSGIIDYINMDDNTSADSTYNVRNCVTMNGRLHQSTSNYDYYSVVLSQSQYTHCDHT